MGSEGRRTPSDLDMLGPSADPVGTMREFFTRRSLMQLRNAFREVDVYHSGCLDIDEFSSTRVSQHAAACSPCAFTSMTETRTRKLKKCSL